MEYSLFLGCTLPVRGQNYELSTRNVCDVLGIKLHYNKDFFCCGFPLAAVDREASLLFSAYNIAVAEKTGMDMMTMCSACTGILTETNHILKEDGDLRSRINKKLSDFHLRFTGSISVKHFARILYEDYGLKKLKGKVKRKLTGWKFATHYGCHYLKPSTAFNKFDDPENPESLDQLIRVTGAESIDYGGKLSCCGGGVLGIEEEIALEVAKGKLDEVKEKDGQAIVLICPFCNVMYEQNQKKIERLNEREYRIPILYYPQVLGLALGLTPKELGFSMNLIKPQELLEVGGVKS
jgi:heterodisulfide reductase subunit B